MAQEFINIIELIERSVFLNLLGAAVSMGYAVDVNDTDEYPKTALGQAAYDAAQQAIISSKGFAVEVFSNSGMEFKGDKKTPRIVLISEGFWPGSRGLSPGVTYTAKNANTFSAIQYPTRSSRLFFRVHIVTERTSQFRILNGIVSVALPSRGYIANYTDNTEKWFIEKLNYLEYSDIKSGISEGAYRFYIDDVLETKPGELYTVAPIKSIEVLSFEESLISLFLDPGD